MIEAPANRAGDVFVCLRTDNFVFIRMRLEDLSRECDKSGGGEDATTLNIYSERHAVK